MPSDSLAAQLALADYRLKVLNRETITVDEYRLLMQSLRGGRDNAARASASHKREARKIMGRPSAGIPLDQMFPQMARTKSGSPSQDAAYGPSDPYRPSTPTDDGDKDA